MCRLRAAPLELDNLWAWASAICECPFWYRSSNTNFPKSEYLIWIRLNISKNSRLLITRTLEGNRKKVRVTREFEADSPTEAHKQMDVEGMQVSCSLLFRAARDTDLYFEKWIKQQSMIKIQGQTLNLNLPVEWQKCKDKELTRLFWNKFNVSDFSALFVFSDLSRA